MRRILYLHGFASSPHGQKIGLLRRALEPHDYRIVAPDLNRPSFASLDFDAIVDGAVRAAAEEPPAVVVGSSLGALVALAAARLGVAAPLVLIAPALGFGSRWIEKLAPGDPVPFFHHGEGRAIPIHRRFFESMARVDVDREPPPQKVVVVMGEADESVPFSGVEAVWKRWLASGNLAAGSRFVPFQAGITGSIGSVGAIAEIITTS